MVVPTLSLPRYPHPLPGVFDSIEVILALAPGLWVYWGYVSKYCYEGDSSDSGFTARACHVSCAYVGHPNMSFQMERALSMERPLLFKDSRLEGEEVAFG
jgi:hypothetical protein